MISSSIDSSDIEDTLIFKKLTEKENEHARISQEELEKNQGLMTQMQSLIDNKQIDHSEITELSKTLISYGKFVFLLYFIDYIRDNYKKPVSKN